MRDYSRGYAEPSDNTHPAVAKFRQEGVHEWQAEEGSTDATQLATILDAQVEATLALAYEARTANLLAYMQPVECSDGTTIGINPDAAANIYEELNVRLGRPTKDAL